MVVPYDATTGIVSSALRYTSTVIPCVIFDKEFWFLLFINLSVFSMRKAGLYHPEDYGLDLPFGLTHTTGGLMTFFVVFYSGHVFARYNDLHDLTKEMLECVVQVAMFLRVNIEDERVRWKVMKLVLASIFMFLFERTAIKDDNTVDNDEDGMSKPEWDQLLQLGFLSKRELEMLEDHCNALHDDAIPSLLVLQWCIEILRATTKTPNDRFDMLDAFDSCFYSCWRAQAAVVNALELPMPFQYFHIMNLMMIINLILWAYSLALQDSWFAPFIFMFVQMMFQGIRELATSLSNPFGKDDVDFPLDDWAFKVYRSVYAVLQTSSVGSTFSIQMQRPDRVGAMERGGRADA